MNVVVVGAGIVGLAHAWAAVRRGHQVVVCERGASAVGASVRNFGMIWPVGQPAGELHDLALKSREFWLQLHKAAGVWVDQCGSIHLAHRADELAVLDEFATKAPELGVDCRLLSRDEVHEHTPAANPEGLLGGLYSPTELCVNPRRAVGQIARWLSENHDVQFHFGSAVSSIVDGEARLADGRSLMFDRLAVCGGADFETLYPELLAKSGLRRCKLQMLKTRPLQFTRPWGPHLAGGLTLRHYANFEVCESLAAVKQRVHEESPELDRYGIHVMASRNDEGEVVLGDSHEYDEAIEPFDKGLIDDLMLRELRKLICLPDWTISERWHGIYAKHAQHPLFEAAPADNIRVCTGTGGAGMTMAFGLADRTWDQWER